MAVRVVSAVIAAEGRVLLTQRLPPMDYPWTWELPGGVVDPGEGDHEALVREVKEEVGADVLHVRASPLWAGAVLRGEGEEGLFVQVFPVVLAAGSSPAPKEGQGLGWFTPEALSSLPSLHPAVVRAALAILSWAVSG